MHRRANGGRKPLRPQQQVDVVDGVVERTAAALHRPASAPAQVVVVLAAMPEGVDLGEQRAPVCPAAHHVDGVADGRDVAGLHHHAQLPATLLRDAQDVVAGRQRRCHGLLQQDVAAGLQSVHSHLLVQRRWRAHADDVHLVQARPIVRHSLRLRKAIALNQPLRALQVAIRQHGHNRISGEREIALDVRGRNAAAANDHHTQHGSSLLFTCTRSLIPHPQAPRKNQA